MDANSQAIRVITTATKARARDGFARLALLLLAAAAVALALAEAVAPDDVGAVEVGEGAPGSLVVVDSAMTGSKTEDGKNDTVEPSGSNTPFQATE